MSISPPSLADERAFRAAVDLRLRALARHRRFFIGGARARAHVAGRFDGAAAHGAVNEVLWERDRPVAHVTSWHEADSSFGPPVTWCLIDRDRGHDHALRWIEGRVRDRFPTPPSTLNGSICGLDRGLLERLLAVGWHISAVVQLGSPTLALRGLADRGRDLGSLDGEIRRFDVGEVDAVLAIQERVFTDAPEHCWFGAHPAHLAACRAALSEPDRTRDRWVVARGDQVLGYFASEIEPADPLWGCRSGMAFVFGPELQRRGVVWAAYRAMFQRMVERGVRTFKGGTSQPAVLALGRRFRRAPLGFELRPTQTFPPDHFLRWFPTG